MTDQKFVLRACLLYDFKMKKSSLESHRNFCEAFGANVLSERTCQEWFRRFREGDESLKDKLHGFRPIVLDNAALLEIIEEDPTQTLPELAEYFECDESTISRHLSLIGKRNRCGQWVPHELSLENKAIRVLLSRILLKKATGSAFFESVLTMDEKWIYLNNTTRKRQWLSKEEKPIPTPHPDLHCKKVMLSVF